MVLCNPGLDSTLVRCSSSSSHVRGARGINLINGDSNRQVLPIEGCQQDASCRIIGSRRLCVCELRSEALPSDNGTLRSKSGTETKGGPVKQSQVLWVGFLVQTPARTRE